MVHYFIPYTHFSLLMYATTRDSSYELLISVNTKRDTGQDVTTLDKRFKIRYSTAITCRLKVGMFIFAK